jgi:hypothetical protein
VLASCDRTTPSAKMGVATIANAAASIWVFI